MSLSAASPSAMTDAGSPSETKPLLNRKPSLIMKPLPMPPAACSPPSATTPTLSLTSKEWVVPPRPKPGRKPATDTPPTKRKAQNRAAQRAFRERRAARVGELEVQIKQVEEDYEKEQDELNSRIAKLETDVEQYRAEVSLWIDKYRRLEKELHALQKSQIRTGRDDTAKSRSQEEEEDAEATVGCGNCTLDTHCQCIDEAFNAMGGEPGQEQSQAEKRPRSPVPITQEKRIKIEAKENLEIDFTAMYSRPQIIHLSSEEVSPTSVIADPCGFCSDGTPCICAEMAAAQEQAQNITTHQAGPGISRTEIHQLAQFTPPPSEGDVSISASTSRPPARGCAIGPGTCAQCQSDPNSTLFCKSLAASRAKLQDANTSQSGCCGGKSANGSCCMTTNSSESVPLRTTRSRTAAAQVTHTLGVTAHPPAAPKTTKPTNAKPSVTLTCADAYTTLSRHPAYERASSEIATWLPKLHASEVPLDRVSGRPSQENRPALEIDAANVMAVLKDFDRRFGQNC